MSPLTTLQNVLTAPRILCFCYCCYYYFNICRSVLATSATFRYFHNVSSVCETQPSRGSRVFSKNMSLNMKFYDEFQGDQITETAGSK